MKLSDGEKLMLIMLCDIQEAQGINTSVNPEFVKSAIYYNCTWGLPWEYPGIPFEDTTTPSTVNNVVNILQMWTIIETSFASLTAAEKKKVENKAQPFGSNPRFTGFEQNSESEEYHIVLFLINHLNRFLNFKGRDLNSSIPLGGRYRRMYEVYEPMMSNLGIESLSADGIIEILLQGS